MDTVPVDLFYDGLMRFQELIVYFAAKIAKFETTPD